MSTFVLIEKYTVGAGGVSSVTLGSGGTIPQTYTDLKLLLSIRSNRSTNPSEGCKVQLNGVATNMTSRYLYGDGSSTTSSTSTTNWSLVNGNSGTSNVFSNSEIYFPNYTNSNYKSSMSDGTGENNATLGYVGMVANLWSNTSAITSISLLPDVGTLWLQYSTFYLYGILKA